jgi:hypothetical protein
MRERKKWSRPYYLRWSLSAIRASHDEGGGI